MAQAKRRVSQHIMESRSLDVVRRVLPEQWVVREYRPDYGIDLTVELFEYLDEEQTQAVTLGETLFVQVKAKQKIETRELRVYPRDNVEKGPLREDRSESRVIEVAPLQMETSELLTIQAMSPAVAVLLLLVDLSTEQVYFLCLNDLIDKVLVPSDPAYAEKASKIVLVPLRNHLSGSNPNSLAMVEFYAKRAKLYAAFQKFRYQHHELSIALSNYRDCVAPGSSAADPESVLGLVRHFLAMDLRLDFWTRAKAWEPIGRSFIELKFLWKVLERTDRPQSHELARRFLLDQPLVQRARDFYAALAAYEAEAHFFMEIESIWHRLETLSRIFEEVVREWFLPTYLSTLLTPDLRVIDSEPRD